MRITFERLKELLDVDLKAHLFVWRVSRGSRVAGALAGSLHNGAIRISLDGRRYYAKHLFALWEFGKWPTPEIKDNPRR